SRKASAAVSNSKLKSAFTPTRNGACAAGPADVGNAIVPSCPDAGDCADRLTATITAAATRTFFIQHPPALGDCIRLRSSKRADLPGLAAPGGGRLIEMTVTIRPASVLDAETIAEIHNQGIVDRMATLDTSLRTPSGVREWLAQRESRYPVIVAETKRGVVGWASLNRFNPRAAYDHVADFSVYVERAWRGKGVGSRLLAALIARARALGFHKMVLAALARNDAGVALYTKAGFSKVGVYREMGMLDGHWVDVLLMEQLL